MFWTALNASNSLKYPNEFQLCWPLLLLLFSVSLPTDLRGFWPLNNTHKLLDLSGHGTVMTKSSTVELGRGLWMELGGSYKFPGYPSLLMLKHAKLYACVRTHTRIHIYTYTCVYICIYIHIYIFTNIYLYYKRGGPILCNAWSPLPRLFA